jgi:GH24 family phage-related lysozyme (muramidase)
METAKKKQRPSAAKIAAEVIKEFEGYSSEPYLCPANVPTIGYGNTMYPNGERVTMEDPEIDQSEAEKQFRRWNKGGGKVLNGLIRRREAEVALWIGEGI